MDALPPRAARKTLAAAPRKKNTCPPRRGYHRSMAQGTPSEKNSLLLKKTLPFMKKNARYLKKAILPALRGLEGKQTPNCGEFWRSGERGFLVLLFSWNHDKSPKFVSRLPTYLTSSAPNCSNFCRTRRADGLSAPCLRCTTQSTAADAPYAVRSFCCLSRFLVADNLCITASCSACARIRLASSSRAHSERLRSTANPCMDSRIGLRFMNC